MYSNPDTHEGPRTRILLAVLQTGLTQSLVPSVAQANIKDVGLYYISREKI